MDFTGIGKIGSFVRQKNLLFAANYKIKTGQSVVNANGNLSFSKSNAFSQLASVSKKSNSAAIKTRLATIKQKLISGKKLSDAEMNFLRENDPKTYKKAKYVAEVREELKAALKSATTKQEAQQAVTQAIVKIAAEATAELAALKDGAGAGGGGGGGVALDADMNADAGANIEGEGVLTANDEIAAESQEITSEISEATDQALNANSETQADNQRSPLDNDDEEWTAQDVVDKFIMAIRAIHDEWKQFTDSDEYKDLPESPLDEMAATGRRRLVGVPDRRILAAVAAYQEAMAARSAV